MTENRITVTINGQEYPMVCAPGEEGKVLALAQKIDEVVRQIAAASGAIGESRLLVMAALILTDRLTDLENAAAENASVLQPDTAMEQPDESRLAAVIENLAERIETLASGG